LTIIIFYGRQKIDFCYPVNEMIRKELLEPNSIVVVGASNDLSKPGGRLFYNILSNGYEGALMAVNPKETSIQGLPCFPDCTKLPLVDLAIIAVASNLVIDSMNILASQKNCKAFIIISAGFSETGEQGKSLEEACASIAGKYNCTLIGPNCIGMVTGKYKGVFAGPVPVYDPHGCDFVSASGATIVYILEMAIPRGLKFRDIFSVGNSAQVGVEDVLEYWDEQFDPAKSSRIKLLYLEHIADPKRFLKHARSLVNKGCRIAAIKAGSTEAGSRAVTSHTGALASPDSAVSALFRKAGIFRCYSRIELVYTAAIFTIKSLKKDRIAVITHAGGPGVMLTDILVKGGMKVPQLTGPKADALLTKLNPGSSVSNPIDFLATGNAKQLGEILDAVENDFEEIDGSVVVFGTTGMSRVDDVYQMLHEKMQSCSKPIFPILPSAIQAAEEVNNFLNMGHVNFTDEVSFGYVLTRMNRLHLPYPDPEPVAVNKKKIRQIIDNAGNGYLSTENVFDLLQAVGIETVKQEIVFTKEVAIITSMAMGFPLVMKISGILHKSDAGGVITGLRTAEEVEKAYEKLTGIEGYGSVILQKQLSGIEVFIGGKDQDLFGHQVICGVGGILVEVLKDVSAGLVPVSKEEATGMIRHLRSYPVIRGVRGKEGLNEEIFANNITLVSALLQAAPEIVEMDINPLFGNNTSLIAVDARISINKNSSLHP
jgi:acyl-CoA synthetase (NDP forming)